MQDEPRPEDILTIVAGFLRSEVMPALSGRTAFHVRVAANAVDLAARQARLGPLGEKAELERLRAMFGAPEGELAELNARLADELANGEADLSDPAVREHLWRTTLDKIAVDQPNYASYRRTLGLFSGTMAVVGGIIGSGIFINPAIVAKRVGSASLTLGVWVLGGVVALIGAFCFGELSQRRPRAGGSYVYIREALGELPAFLYGWALLLVMATGAIAAVAYTFASYFTRLAGLDAALITPIAAAAILLFMLSHIYLGTTGKTVGALFRMMFTGWHERGGVIMPGMIRRPPTSWTSSCGKRCVRSVNSPTSTISLPVREISSRRQVLHNGSSTSSMAASITS